MSVYKETVKSHKAKLESEIKTILDILPQFNSRNPYEHRHTIRQIRHSIQKAELYVSSIEQLAEQDILDSKNRGLAEED